MAQDSDSGLHSFIPANSPRPYRVSSPGSSARKRTHADIHNTDDLRHGNNHVSIKTEQEDEEGERGGKRSRTTGWPLQDVSVAGGKRLKDQKASRKSQSPQRKRQAGRFNWQSRFKEGSMNDRPSSQPPIEYIGQDQFIQEQLMEQYTAERAEMNERNSEDTNPCYDAGIQSARPSSMYRFGKALVNAFNPIMVWHGLNGKWRERTEEESNPEKELLDQRRVKAETAYAELKRAGYPGTQNMSTVDISSTKLEHDRALTSSRDSGIDVDSYRSSSERKRDGLVFDAGGVVMVQQPGSGIGTSAGLGPEIPTEPRSSLHVRKASFTSLKKVKSHLQLPTSKRHSASPALIPSIEVDHVQNSAEKKTIRKQLSRKDLQKQQKLTKKVSDLETKLEKARRELHQSMDDIPPVPPLPSGGNLRPFVPGALASLPSERLLSEHLIESTSSLHDPATERVNSFCEMNPDLAEPRSRQAQTPIAKKVQKLTGTTPRAASTGKRKSGDSDELLRKSALNSDEEIGAPTETKSAENKGRKKPPKSPKIDLRDSPRACESVQDSTVLHEITNSSSIDYGTMNGPAAVGKGTFDPTKVDIAKMLALRSDPDSIVPFGKLSDDICNLRKEFPNITNDQIIEYISVIFNSENKHPMGTSSRHILPADSTPLSNTSDLSQKQPRALDLTRGMSPSKGTPKSCRSLSPPPSYDNSRTIETDLHNSWGKPDDDAVRVSPKKNKNVPPVPKVPKALEGRTAKVLEEVTEKEEWQWDDDVF
ncbi:hypothetical protein MMC11_007844 [Xylographa trunciseda]|nr:hypothetical protein [Xylographa trunciseda]